MAQGKVVISFLLASMKPPALVVEAASQHEDALEAVELQMYLWVHGFEAPVETQVLNRQKRSQAAGEPATPWAQWQQKHLYPLVVQL